MHRISKITGKRMNIKEIDGVFRAYKTTGDTVHELDSHDEFLVSKRVAQELKKSPVFLNEGYWHLAIGKDSNSLIWEISVKNVSLQIPLKGQIYFENELPVLA